MLVGVGRSGVWSITERWWWWWVFQSAPDDRVTYHRSIQFFLLSPSWKSLHTVGTYLNIKLMKEILAP